MNKAGTTPAPPLPSPLTSPSISPPAGAGCSRRYFDLVQCPVFEGPSKTNPSFLRCRSKFFAKITY